MTVITAAAAIALQCTATSQRLLEDDDVNRREIGHATWTDSETERQTDRAIVMGRQ